jgi:hypothetical protein
MHRTLNDIDDELGRAVFMALYQSRRQRLRRRVAMLLLVVKHLGRGLVMIWPVYLVGLALLLLPGVNDTLWYLLALTPGVIGWLLIYLRGVRRDYKQHVAGRLLEAGDYRKLLLH